MIKKIIVLGFLLCLSGCQALDPFGEPTYKERPARENENRLHDLSMGLQLNEVRGHMGSGPIHNSIDPKHPFSNPIVTHNHTDESGKTVIIDVYVTYAVNIGSCPERSYRSEPAVFIENVLVAVGWDYVRKYHAELGVNDLWIRRGREYMYQHDCH
ncbi:MAG: hypothetical protein JKY01_07725 [Pseudomonadales bacterium]|nr:hypothetical protein [Pseudomonadales bacterium]